MCVRSWPSTKSNVTVPTSSRIDVKNSESLIQFISVSRDIPKYRAASDKIPRAKINALAVSSSLHFRSLDFDGKARIT